MASFAEMIGQNAMKSVADSRDPNAGSGVAQGMQVGAQLAIEQQKHQAQMKDLQQKQQQFQSAQVEKIFNFMSTGMQHAKNGAELNSVLRSTGAMRDAMGIDKALLPDEGLKALGTTEDQQRWATGQSLVADKKMTQSELIDLATNPYKRDQWLRMAKTPLEGLRRDDKLSEGQRLAIETGSREKIAALNRDASKNRADASRTGVQDRFDSALLDKQLNQFNATSAKIKDRLQAASTVETVLNSNTSLGSSAVKRMFARLAGEVGTMTDQDVADFSGGRAWIQQAEQKLKMGAEGMLTEDNRKEMTQLLNDLRGPLTQRLQNEADRSLAKARALGIPEDKMREGMALDKIIRTSSGGGDDKNKQIPILGKSYTRDQWMQFVNDPKHAGDPALEIVKKAIGVK